MIAAPALLRAAPAPVDFGRDILPILSDNCFHCHGPDEKARKAKLRLDTREGALRLKDPVVIPGKSAQSELVKRITTTDADDQMPPPDSKRKLTPAQIALLKRWVDEGVVWGKHWAFAPLKRPAVTPAGNPVDALVAAMLAREGLKFSPEADARTLLASSHKPLRMVATTSSMCV